MWLIVDTSKTNTQNKLRESILCFFRDNPEETLTVDDIDAKFDGGFHLEEVLDNLVSEKLLRCSKDLYSLPKSQQPKPKKVKAVKAEPKPRKPRAWKPSKTNAKLKLGEVPRWIAANQPSFQPRKEYDRAQSRLIVGEFWNMVEKGESCELWANYDTGEKAIFPIAHMPSQAWMPLLRSVHGTVVRSENIYRFPKL